MPITVQAKEAAFRIMREALVNARNTLTPAT